MAGLQMPEKKRFSDYEEVRSPLLPRKWCFIFPLQVGVIAISVSGFTLVVITLIKNIFDTNSEDSPTKAAQYFLLLMYLSIMIVPFIMGFLGAFWRNRTYLKVSTFLLGVGLLLYVIYSILSFLPTRKFLIVACPGFRCPDHHWLVASQWRESLMDVEKDPPKEKDVQVPDRDFEVTNKDDYDYEDQPEQEKTLSHGLIVYCLFGTVVMSILYISFLIWAMFTFLGLGAEIKFGPPP